MARKKAADVADAEPNADALEAKRLESLAIDQGILSRTRRIATTTLPPTSAMLKADGKDIVKRSSVRRNRYLLVFNCQIAPAAAGRLGVLSCLDTKNPVMHIEFPEGRLRLRGTLVFPRNKYLVMRLGNKEALCEDVLESMVVFSEMDWVGRAEDNPDEEALPMPESVKTERRHERLDFGGRGAGRQEGSEEDDEDEEDVGDEPFSQSQRSRGVLRSTARRTGGSKKRTRYADDSDNDFVVAGDSDEEEEELVLRKPRKKQALAAAPQPASHPNNLVDYEDDAEEQPLAMQKKQQAKKAAAAPPVKRDKHSKTAHHAASSAEEEEEEEEEDLDGMEVVPASRARPKRAAAGEANKKLRQSQEGGSEDGEAGDDLEEEDGEEESSGASEGGSEEEYERDVSDGDE